MRPLIQDLILDLHHKWLIINHLKHEPLMINFNIIVYSSVAALRSLDWVAWPFIWACCRCMWPLPCSRRADYWSAARTIQNQSKHVKTMAFRADSEDFSSFRPFADRHRLVGLQRGSRLRPHSGRAVIRVRKRMVRKMRRRAQGSSDGRPMPPAWFMDFP